MLQKLQSNKKEQATPKHAAIEKMKKDFLINLKSNSGNVSKALEVSGLNRQTAYRHFGDDEEFRNAWLDATEYALDELVVEARRRAVEGVKREIFDSRGNVIGTKQEYSDRLLIFMMSVHERQRKWRGRTVQTAQAAIDTVESSGKEIGISNEQIERLTEKMIEKYKEIPLI
ncbi:MAG: hypothetical protein WKF90_16630 [Pyrinomonadaceae bacterium]